MTNATDATMIAKAAMPPTVPPMMAVSFEEPPPSEDWVGMTVVLPVIELG